jgi:hypothetical protein
MVYQPKLQFPICHQHRLDPLQGKEISKFPLNVFKLKDNYIYKGQKILKTIVLAVILHPKNWPRSALPLYCLKWVESKI